MKVEELTGEYFWWRKDKSCKWELCLKTLTAYAVPTPILRFFNGSRISGNVWGDIVPATVQSPSYDLGWECEKSPDGYCHYNTEDGKIRLINSTLIDPPKDHNPENETEDSCIFCGNPEERK